MGACCEQPKKKKIMQKNQRESSYYTSETYEVDKAKEIEKLNNKKRKDKELKANDEQDFVRPPPTTYLKGQGVSIGTGEVQNQKKLTAEEIVAFIVFKTNSKKQKQLEAAEKRLESNQNRGLTSQAQIDMIFKAEREKDADKFKNGNEQYYLKYK